MVPSEETTRGRAVLQALRERDIRQERHGEACDRNFTATPARGKPPAMRATSGCPSSGRPSRGSGGPAQGILARVAPPRRRAHVPDRTGLATGCKPVSVVWQPPCGSTDEV